MIPDDPPEDADAFADPLDLAALPDAGEAAVRLDRLVRGGRGGARARLGLGLALIRTGAAAAAAETLREAAFLAPNDPGIRTALGTALLDMGDHRAAIAALQHALRLAPHDAAASFRLGMAWEALGERDRALGFYDTAAETPGDPSGAGARAAALRQSAPVARHTASFVRHLFDAYAGDYDSNMRETLGYRGPELLLAPLVSRLGAPAGRLDIGDLGCGTGLCGPLLRPWARRLDGVDLSPGMLAVAARGGAYDALDEADLIDWLGARAGRFDLLVAADVLNYFGDLAPVFAVAVPALRPGGLLAFSVEAHDVPGWSLGPKRRFRHGGDYAAATAAAAGLAILQADRVVLRCDAGVGVDGLMIVASRS